MDLAALLPHDMVRLLAWTLVHSLWQLALVGLAVAALLPWLGRSDARARHGLCLVGLVLMAGLPLLTFGLLAAAGAPTGDLPLAGRLATDGLLPAVGDAPATPARPLPWTAWLTGLWALGASVCLARTVRAWRHDQRLGRDGQQPAPAWLEHAAGQLARELGLARGVRVAVSSLAAVPAVVGWTSPVVLLPVAALDALRPDQLRAVLAHELAHVVRHDALVNLFQACLESLFFFHPAVWWLSGRLRIEREYCCDDLAVAASGDALVFARALSNLDALAALPAPRGALSSQGGPLMERISRLVGRTDRPPTGRLAGATLGLVMLAAVSTSAAVLGDEDGLPTVLSLGDGRIELDLTDCADDCTLILRRDGDQISVIRAGSDGETSEVSAPRASTTGQRRYVVQVGDSLPAIAKAHVAGDDGLHRKVLRLRTLNPGVDADRLAVGQALVLPDDQPAGPHPLIALRQRHGDDSQVTLRELSSDGSRVVVLDSLGQALQSLQLDDLGLDEIDTVLAEVDGVLAELDIDALVEDALHEAHDDQQHVTIDLADVDDLLADLDIDALVEDALHETHDGQHAFRIDLQAIDDVLDDLDIDALVEDALHEAHDGQHAFRIDLQAIDDVLDDLDIDALVEDALHEAHDGQHSVRIDLQAIDDVLDDLDIDALVEDALHQHQPAPHAGHHRKDLHVLPLGDDDGQGVRVLRLGDDDHQGAWSIHRDDQHGTQVLTLSDDGDEDEDLSSRLRKALDRALGQGLPKAHATGRHRVEVITENGDGQPVEVHGEVLIVGPDGEPMTVRTAPRAASSGTRMLRIPRDGDDDVLIELRGHRAPPVPAAPSFQVRRPRTPAQLPGRRLMVQPRFELKNDQGVVLDVQPRLEVLPEVHGQQTLPEGYRVLRSDDGQTLILELRATDETEEEEERADSDRPATIVATGQPAPEPVSVRNLLLSAFGILGGDEPVAVSTSSAPVAVGSVRRTGPAPVAVSSVRRAGPAPVAVGSVRRTGPAPVAVSSVRRAGPAPVAVGSVRRAGPAPVAVGSVRRTGPAPVVVGTRTVSGSPAPVVVGTARRAGPAPVVVGTRTVSGSPAPVVGTTIVIQGVAPSDSAGPCEATAPAPPCEQECGAVEETTEADIIT